MKRIVALLSVCLLPLVSAGASPVSEPVRSIAPSTYGGFTNAIVLHNRALRVVILPDAGRIVSLALADAPSPLREDSNLVTRGVCRETGGWANLGGLWLWPAAQNRWKAAYGRDWPPPEAFEGRPWRALAWSTSDGGSVCRLTLDVDAPWNIRVIREIALPSAQPRIVMNQSIERTGPSDLPVALWNIAQIAAADEVVLPAASAPSGFVQLGFDALPAGAVQVHSNSVVVGLAAATEHKAGSDSSRGWIAARRGQLVTLLRAAPAQAGAFPDGGCRVEMYTNKGLGYTEIETLGEERNLKQGQRVENTVTVELYRAPRPVSGADLARWIRQLAGEEPFKNRD